MNTNIQIIYKSYIIKEVLFTTNKKQFAKKIFNKNIVVFIIYLTFFSLQLKILIYLTRKA